MPLTAEAVIALVGVVLAVPPVSVLVWRWRVSVRRAEAIRRALSDTEMQVTPARSASPSSAATSPVPCAASATPVRILSNQGPGNRVQERLEFRYTAVYHGVMSTPELQQDSEHH